VERDNDTSSRITPWKYALQVEGIYPFGLNGRGALTESNAQALVFTKAISHEEDRLATGGRPIIWGNSLKGNRRSERDFERGGHKTLGIRLVRTQREK